MSETEEDKHITFIKEIFKRFELLEDDIEINLTDITTDFMSQNIPIIEQIKIYYESLSVNELALILFSFIFARKKTTKNLLNILDVMNTIISNLFMKEILK